jgi:hypothetical protein
MQERVGRQRGSESVKVVEKNAEMVESSGEGEARAMKGNIKPYCHRCLAKGHVKEECAVVLVCDICSSQSHLKHRCPLQKKASKIFAMTSGYVVDGLGFYYIPHQSSSSRLRGDHNGAVIRVLEGFLLRDQVALEMDRLVLGPTKWAMQEVDRNTFKANFQSRIELNRMVEWGVVQTKDKMAKMMIEESSGGSHYKQALCRVWVQMTGLPGELREYLTIWAIGTIRGVMKDVDMKFTREFERACFNVLVLDPSLIPQSVDVVIGEFIYELHFWVERDDMGQPAPIDMDDETMEEQDDDRNDRAGDSKNGQKDSSSQQEGSGNSLASNLDVGDKRSNHGKVVLCHIPSLEMQHESDHEEDKVEDVVNTGDDYPASEPPSPIVHEGEMAAIPKSVTPGKRSKHRADSVDESSLEHAEWMKTARNLDFKGNKHLAHPSFLPLSNDLVMSNLDVVGITLGLDKASIESSLANLRQAESDRVQCKPKINTLDSLLELEEKEEIENEEVDKLILNSLCSEIMDEVMDMSSAYPMDCKSTPMSKTSPTSTTRAKKRKNKKGRKSV